MMGWILAGLAVATIAEVIKENGNNSGNSTNTESNQQTKYKTNSDTASGGHRRRDYKEILKKIPPLGGVKAGIMNDIKKQRMLNGGAFWHLDELARHVGGKTTTYASYNGKINGAMANGYIDKGISVLLEALEYARQKGDVSEYFYYRYILGKWTNNIEDRIKFLNLMVDYYLIQKDENPPAWIGNGGVDICNDFYTHLSKVNRNSNSGAAEIQVFDELLNYLYYNYITNEEKFEIVLMYRGLLIFLTQGTSFHNTYYGKRHALFNDIRKVSKNYERLKHMWKNAGFYVYDI